MKLILLGPPGAGKGTQALRLAEAYSVPHVSTGDLFRDNIRRGSSLGLQARSYIDRGQLVPDEVTTAMVFDRIAEQDCVSGFILDGYPRNMVQAIALEEVATPDAVIDLSVDFDVLKDRLCGRRVCAGCHRVYHIDMGVTDRCPACGQPLVQRNDDTPQTVIKRLEAYQEQTSPLTAYYAGRGLLVRVDGAASIDEVTRQMLAKLEAHVQGKAG